MLKLIGHRFFASYAPENSLAALENAISHSPWALETDIQISKDGVPIVMHDRWLDRTTNVSGRVNDYTVTELDKICRLSNGEKIPRLDDVIDLLAGTDIRLYIEIITPETFPAIASRLSLIKESVDIVLSSFHHDVIRLAKQTDKTLRTMALFECSPVDPVCFTKHTLADEIGVGFDSISETFVQKMEKEKYPLYAWTINSFQELKFAKALGLNGVFSDNFLKEDR